MNRLTAGRFKLVRSIIVKVCDHVYVISPGQKTISIKKPRLILSTIIISNVMPQQVAVHFILKSIRVYNMEGNKLDRTFAMLGIQQLRR